MAGPLAQGCGGGGQGYVPPGEVSSAQGCGGAGQSGWTCLSISPPCKAPAPTPVIQLQCTAAHFPDKSIRTFTTHSVAGLVIDEGRQVMGDTRASTPDFHTLFPTRPHLCSIVCLVVDECHRAVGNAAMAKAVSQLRKARVQFRLLGLSATPGSTHEAIQVWSGECGAVCEPTSSCTHQ